MVVLVDANGHQIGRVGMPLGVCKEHRSLGLTEVVNDKAWTQLADAMAKAGYAAPDRTQSQLEYIEQSEAAPGAPIGLVTAASRVMAAIGMLSASAGREPMVQAARHLSHVAHRAAEVFFSDAAEGEERHNLAVTCLALSSAAEDLAAACVAQDVSVQPTVDATEMAGLRLRAAAQAVGVATVPALKRMPGDP